MNIDQQLDSDGAIQPIQGELRDLPGFMRQYYAHGRWHDMFFYARNEQRKPGKTILWPSQS